MDMSAFMMPGLHQQLALDQLSIATHGHFHGHYTLCMIPSDLHVPMWIHKTLWMAQPAFHNEKFTSECPNFESSYQCALVDHRKKVRDTEYGWELEPSPQQTCIPSTGSLLLPANSRGAPWTSLSHPPAPSIILSSMLAIFRAHLMRGPNII